MNTITGTIYAKVFPQGETYVGQTRMKESERWKCHVIRANAGCTKQLLSVYIRKYGAENVKTFILFSGETTLEKLGEMEDAYVKGLNTLRNGKNKGLNLREGGIHYGVSDERKKELSDQWSGSGNPNYGKYGKDHPCYGRKPGEEETRIRIEKATGVRPNEETRMKMSISAKNRKKKSLRGKDGRFMKDERHC